MPEPTTHTEVPKGHGVFPPFDKSTFPSQLFWLSVTFVLLYLLMARVALPRIASILEGRRKHIDDHLAQAQRLKERSDAARLASEMALSEARTHGQNLANEMRAKAAADGEGRLKDADVKLRAQITEAEKAIAAARSVAMTKVRDIATDAARAIVERLAGIAPADQDVAKAVRDALKRRS